MFPQFLKHKLKEIGSFMRIIRGQVTQNKHKRIQGTESALEEKHLAEQVKQPEAGQEKVLRQSGGQDISAI